jgi:hypothetical protein
MGRSRRWSFRLVARVTAARIALDSPSRAIRQALGHLNTPADTAVPRQTSHLLGTLCGLPVA